VSAWAAFVIGLMLGMLLGVLIIACLVMNARNGR